MAGSLLQRFIRIIFDSAGSKQAEDQLAQGVGDAGKRGGANFAREMRVAFDRTIADLKVALAKGLISPATFKAQGDLAARQFNTGILAGMEKARAAGTLTDGEYLKLSRTLKKVGTDGSSMAGMLTSSFLRMATAVAGAFALSRIEHFFADSIHKAIEEEEAIGRLRVALSTIGRTYESVAPEANGYFDTIQRTTRFSKVDARDALTNLIVITGDYQKSLSLLSLTAEVAEKRHITMAEAATTVGGAALGLGRRMVDLGVKTGETGDIIAKMRNHLGDLAETAGAKTAGKVAISVNLWNDFKRSLGLAVIGSDDLQNSLGPHGLQKVLIDLDTWVKNNGAEISNFVTLTAQAIGLLAKGIGAIQLLWGNKMFVPGGAQLIATETQRLNAEAAAMAAARERAEATWTRIHGEGAAARRLLSEDERRTLFKITEEGGTELVNLTAKDLASIEALRRADEAGLITLTRPQAAAIKKVSDEVAAQEAQRKKAFTERTADIAQEIADLHRLAAAYGIDRAAVEAAERALKTDAEVRTAAKGLSAAQRVELDRLVAARDRERLTIEALKRSQDINQEIGDLRKLADAYHLGASAVDAVEQSLHREQEIRAAIKDLAPADAERVRREITLRYQLAQANDAAGRGLAVRQEISDAQRLAAIRDAEPRALAQTVLQLQREAEVRTAIKGLTIEQAIALAALLKIRNATQDTGRENQFLGDLQRETDILERRWQAERQGYDAVRALDRELFIQAELIKAGAKAGSDYEKAIKRMAGAQWDAAHKFSGGWVSGMKLIQNEVKGQGTLFHDLGLAWAEGGLAGLAQLAKGKAQEMLASAIEWTAKGLGMLAFGDPHAGAAFASAAEFGLGAAAWEAVAAATGGAGGGGSASTAGGVGGSSHPSGGSSGAAQQQQEINLYFTGPSVFNPEFQKAIRFADQQAAERFGPDVKVIIHRGP